MESADSPWGDMVRTATSLHTCSSCSWDRSTSTLPAVGEATSMICRWGEAQDGKGRPRWPSVRTTITATASIMPGTVPSPWHALSHLILLVTGLHNGVGFLTLNHLLLKPMLLTNLLINAQMPRPGHLCVLLGR